MLAIKSLECRGRWWGGHEPKIERWMTRTDFIASTGIAICLTVKVDQLVVDADAN